MGSRSAARTSRCCSAPITWARRTTNIQAPTKPAARRRLRSSRQKALLAASILADKKARDAVVLDLRKLTVIADFFVICTGASEVHVRALAEELVKQLREAGVRSAATQGVSGGHWALVDLGDVIIHIFTEFERGFYDLERLWGDAPRVKVK